MKTIEELNAQLQRSSSIEDSIAIRIRMIELKRKFKKINLSVSPISDLLTRIHQNKKLQLGF